MLEAGSVLAGLAPGAATSGAVLCAAVAAWLVAWRPGRRPTRRLRVGPHRRRWSVDAVRRTWLLALAVPGVAVAAVGPRPAAVVALVALGLVAIVLRRRDVLAARTATELTAAVAELATALAADVTAGHAPVTSLEALAAEQRGAPDTGARRQLAARLDGVVTAARLGADVPAALRRQADVSGAEGLRALAAGWDVAAASGAALAPVLAGVAEGLRDQLACDRAIGIALAGARSTARLLAGLPIVGLAIGAGLGLSPVGFLLDTSIGRGCLLVGLGLEVVGLVWTDALAAAAVRGRR